MNQPFMLRKWWVLFFSLPAGLVLAAQDPVDRLLQWSQQHPIEKIFLHTDRNTYHAGETVWYKAYLSADHLPDTISSTLYVELVRPGDLSVTGRSIVPVFFGTSAGQLELPDSLTSGLYTLRAYTTSMASQAAGFIYRKGIYIVGRGEMDTNRVQLPMKIEFFPEGGNLVAGITNTIAFKATHANGLPAPEKGVIKNSRGEEVVSFDVFHEGMGMFELNPVAGQKYTAVTADGQFELPAVTEQGVVLTLLPHNQGSFFEVQHKATVPAFIPAFMIGQMQHRLVFRHDFNALKESARGVINTTHLRSGIMQVTVFNKEGMPLAERLWFVNNGEYRLPAVLITDSLDFSARGRNRFRIMLADTVQGSISVSITDAAYADRTEPGENIITTLLLTSDLKGYIHRPVFYFSSDNDSIKTALDLLMMTNGWRRFRWTELPSVINKPAATNPSYITLSGKATLRGSSRPFGDKTLLLLLNNLDGSKKRITQMLQTDKEGNFFIDSLLFFGRNRLLFSDVRGKKSQYIDVNLKGDSLHRAFRWKDFPGLPAKNAMVPVARWQMDYAEMMKANGLMLEGVTIRVQKKSAAEQVEEKYTSGMFSGDATRAIDLVNNDEALPYNNIFDYLQNRVNGLQVINDGAEYGVYFRQTSTISSMGNPPVTIFLDEIETDVSVVAAIPANQVALVKLYSSFAGAAGNAPGGVLAIYTKKGEDYGKSGSYANVAIYNGYSVVKEFYAPDYREEQKTNKADNRITIDWRPNIFINSIDPRIPVSFYNTDRTKKFKVVVEGMTTSGKLICLEKLVTGGQ